MNLRLGKIELEAEGAADRRFKGGVRHYSVSQIKAKACLPTGNQRISARTKPKGLAAEHQICQTKPYVVLTVAQMCMRQRNGFIAKNRGLSYFLSPARKSAGSPV